jgi:NTP pyrophosphatase (non-canonical NTP hydrolase)
MSDATNWKDGWRHLSQTNLKRCLLWHPNGLEEWSISDWAVAAAGEMGEVCDAVKKMNRARDGLQGKTSDAEAVGKEIADTVIYLDLLAQRLGFDLADLVEQKFNEVSDREGFDIKLGGGPEAPAIPDGFLPYDGSGQPVADDVVVSRLHHASGIIGAPWKAGALEWPDTVLAYRIIHDPARLPDVPWEDYPEARWATLDSCGVLAVWMRGEVEFDGRMWDCELSLTRDDSFIKSIRSGVDMTHLDPARCKWERPITPGAYKDADGRQPATEDGDSVALIVPEPVRKSIDDAKPEEWDRVAAASKDAHVLRMDLKALERRVTSIERSLMRIDRRR